MTLQQQKAHQFSVEGRGQVRPRQLNSHPGFLGGSVQTRNF
jgi:hypothetical protein